MKRFGILVAACGVLAAGLWFYVPGHSVAWRAYLIAAKYQGHFPDASWRQVLAIMPPRQWIDALSIREKRREDGPCAVLWDTPLGEFWSEAADEPALRIVIGEQLKQIYQRSSVVVRPDDVVMDVGGHLGTFTRVALNRKARLVVIFEPNRQHIACLKKTFKDEMARGRVKLVEAAVWYSPGTLTFSGQGLSYRPTAISGGEPIDTVAATTLDETVESLGLQRVDFIKMDIEGSERHALAGARGTLARFGPRMAICTYHSKDDPVVIPRVVTEIRPAYQMFSNHEEMEQIFFY
jgi:FkbM family methyltransferase